MSQSTASSSKRGTTRRKRASGGRRSSERIRLALVGIGNVASALTQALCTKNVSGVWHDKIGGYSKDDVRIVAAFDIDKRKVGRDVSEAIFSSPNVSPEFARVLESGVIVQPGLECGETPKHLLGNLVSTDDFDSALKSCDADIVLNLIPSGMQDTSIRYAEASLEAGCCFINASPASVATNPEMGKRFQKARLVLAGDDLLSQFGGTAFHKGILEFMNRRGLSIEKSYQLDVGGGNETLNTITESVKLAKRDIKTEAIAEEIPYRFKTVAGTTDYVDYMGNNRTSYFWIQAKSMFGSETKIDVYLRTNDGANATNVLLDAIRAVARARLRKRYGAQKEICEYAFKKLLSPAHLRDAQNEFLGLYGRN